MFKAKMKMMTQLGDFIELILNSSESDSRDPSIMMDIQSFQKSLSDYNESPENKDSRPFLMLPKDITKQILPATILKILAIASDNDIYRDFVKVSGEGRDLVFFSHEAVDLIESIADEFNITYTNILSNGIVFNEFNFIGLYTASKDRLECALEDIRRITVDVDKDMA